MKSKTVPAKSEEKSESISTKIKKRSLKTDSAYKIVCAKIIYPNKI